MLESLGVDLGNVIIDHVGFGTTPEFLQFGDYNSIPAVKGVFEALERLNQERFNGNIFVVYNASDVANQKIVSWLRYHNFSKKTGIGCRRIQRTKKGRDKSSVCDIYGATHFIDDRLEVLGHLVGKVEHLYLFRPQECEVGQYEQFLPYIRKVLSWEEILQLLLF